MASIFKRRKSKGEPYTIQYVDCLGKRRTVKGFTDKGLTAELGAKLETEARLRRTGLVDPRQDQMAQHQRSDVDEHLTAFEASLADNSPKHVKDTMNRVRAIIEGAEVSRLSDLESTQVLHCLRKLRRERDLSPRTYNHYLQAINSFCNWCVPKRMLANPLADLEKLNAEIEVRHQRRALSTEEVWRLIEAARDSGKRAQNLAPELRARAYTFAYYTGLRKQEMASLAPNSFKLDDLPPTVTVAAACSKHRRKDVLPLHPDLVKLLRVWLKGLKPAEKLFPLLGKKKLSEMIRQDLKRAGIPYRTVDGVADFHAAGRHTYITQLLRSGASLPEAMALARHTDVKMTMRYTHIGMDDRAKAVAYLPKPENGKKASPKDALHGRCNSGGSKARRMSSIDNQASNEARRNPMNSKSYGVQRHQMAATDKAEGMGFEPTTP